MGLRAIIFDADGTLLDGDNPYMSLAERLGVKEMMQPEVDKYLAGELEYELLGKVYCSYINILDGTNVVSKLVVGIYFLVWNN